MIVKLLGRFKWLGMIALLTAVLLAGPLEEAGAGGRLGAQSGQIGQTVQDVQADQTGRKLPVTAEAAASPPILGGAPVNEATASGASRKLALIDPAAAAEPDLAEIEESDLFANLDKWLDRFETVEVVATGYSAGKESTGKTPGHPEYGITYSGVKVRKDKFSTIAADPKVFPLGTVLYIPGYGFGVVADTGSKIKGHKIDLYFKTKNQVYQQWGKKTVRVHVLIRGDGKVTEAMMDRLNALKTVPVEQAEAAPSKSQ